MPHVEPAGADQTHVIRALVVDDSAVLRRLISNVLASDPEIEVVGTAVDGLDAIEKADVLRPDVMTLDVEMPRLDGLGAVKEISGRHPRLPVGQVWKRWKSAIFAKC